MGETANVEIGRTTFGVADVRRGVMLAGVIDAPESRTGVCPTCRGKRFSHAGEMGQARRSTRRKCAVCKGEGSVAVGNTKR